MFDFAWSEFGLIAIVALIAIGPKDLPVAMRAVSDVIKKARRMAGEFQTHVDEMVRDTELGDVRKHIGELRNFDVRREVEKAVDPDRSIRDTLGERLVPAQKPYISPVPPAADAAMTPHPILAVPVVSDSKAAAAPAFVPPRFAKPAERPAFIPPGADEPRA